MMKRVMFTFQTQLNKLAKKYANKIMDTSYLKFVYETDEEYHKIDQEVNTEEYASQKSLINQFINEAYSNAFRTVIDPLAIASHKSIFYSNMSTSEDNTSIWTDDGKLIIRWISNWIYSSISKRWYARF